MDKLMWHDAKIDKPTEGDPVLGLTSNGYIVIVQYDSSKSIGKWYELSRDETYDNIVWWADFKLPHGWSISDDYYPEER